MLPGLTAPILTSAGELSIRNIIHALGAQANLLTAYDAGSQLSWPGSGQLWQDIAGSNQHLFRGTSFGVDAYDPAFVGVAGRLSAADYFTLDKIAGAPSSYDFEPENTHDYYTRFVETADQTWADAFHYYGAQFTIGGVIFLPASFGFANTKLFYNTNSGRGIMLRSFNQIQSGAGSSNLARLMFWANDAFGRANVVIQLPASPSDTQVGLRPGQWNFWAFSYNESLGIWTWNVNGENMSGTGAFYNTPSSGPAEHPYTMMWTNLTNNSLQWINGFRIGAFFAAGRKWSTTELTALYTELKLRWPFTDGFQNYASTAQFPQPLGASYPGLPDVKKL